MKKGGNTDDQKGTSGGKMAMDKLKNTDEQWQRAGYFHQFWPSLEIQKLFNILRHIESWSTCIKH